MAIHKSHNLQCGAYVGNDCFSLSTSRRTMASPRSASFTVKSEVTKKFSDFMSQCITPFECKYANPAQQSRIICSRMDNGSKLPIASMEDVPDSTQLMLGCPANSMTRRTELESREYFPKLVIGPSPKPISLVSNTAAGETSLMLALCDISKLLA
jgi:hypothetical protein